MTATVTSKQLIENCTKLKNLEVKMVPSIFTSVNTDSYPYWPSVNTCKDRFDLLAQTKCEETGEVKINEPASRRVTGNWDLRQPLDMLKAIGFDEFAGHWDFMHKKTEYLYEGRKGNSHRPIVGVRIVLVSPLEEYYTKNLGPHSLEVEMDLYWNGSHSDKLRVDVRELWCTNGCTRRNGLYYVAINHKKKLMDSVDNMEIQRVIWNELEWKRTMADIPLEDPLEVELVDIYKWDTDGVRDVIDLGAGQPDVLNRIKYTQGIQGVFASPSAEVYQCTESEKDTIGSRNRVFLRGYQLPEEDRSVDKPDPVGYLSSRFINKMNTAIEQESQKDTWRGNTLLDLHNVVTRASATEGNKVSASLEQSIDRVFNKYREGHGIETVALN